MPDRPTAQTIEAQVLRLGWEAWRKKRTLRRTARPSINPGDEVFRHVRTAHDHSFMRVRARLVATLLVALLALVACASSGSRDAPNASLPATGATEEANEAGPVPATSEIKLEGEVTGLAADGERALIATGVETDELGPLAVFYWDNRTGRVVKRRTSSFGDWVGPLALAGGTAAFSWSYEGGGLGFSEIGLRVWHPEEPRASGLGWNFSPAAGPLNVKGDGKLLVFNTVSRGRPRLWRVRRDRRELLLQGPGARPIVDVERGCIAIRRGATVVLRDKRGRLTKTITISTDRPRAVALTAERLLVQDTSGLEMYDIASGTTRGRWPLVQDGTSQPELLDAEGDLAVYVGGFSFDGPAIHVLRLSDGKDITLDLGEQTGFSGADLEPTGLFYAYNTANEGRAGFVGVEDLHRLLDTEPGFSR